MHDILNDIGKMHADTKLTDCGGNNGDMQKLWKIPGLKLGLFNQGKKKKKSSIFFLSDF